MMGNAYIIEIRKNKVGYVFYNRIIIYIWATCWVNDWISELCQYTLWGEIMAWKYYHIFVTQFFKCFSNQDNSIKMFYSHFKASLE